jgi:hypothetical protein
MFLESAQVIRGYVGLDLEISSETNAHNKELGTIATTMLRGSEITVTVVGRQLHCDNWHR